MPAEPARDSPPEPEPESAGPVTLRMPVDVRTVMLAALTTAALIFTLKYSREVFIPIAVAVLISYALHPVVSWFGRRGIARVIGSALVLLALVGVLGSVGYALRDDVSALIDRLPGAARSLRASVRQIRWGGAAPIEQVRKAATEIERAAQEATGAPPVPSGVTRVQVEQPTFNVREYFWWGSTGLLAFAGQIVTVLFLAFFLLVSADTFKHKLVKIAGRTLAERKVTVEILDDINRQIERYLLVLLFTNAVVGVTTWLAFRWLGLEQAGLWGALAGAFNSIPYFGPLMVMAGATVVALVQFGTLKMAVAVGGISLAITSLEGYLLTPYLASRAGNINPVAVLVGLLLWGWIWGVWGMLLSTPLLIAVKAICDRVEDLKPIGELLGE